MRASITTKLASSMWVTYARLPSGVRAMPNAEMRPTPKGILAVTVSLDVSITETYAETSPPKGLPNRLVT